MTVTSTSRHLALACALTIGASALVLARVQRLDTSALKAIAGHEKKAHEQTTIVSPPLSKAESETIVGKIQAIRKLLLDTPALQGLRGYDWATFGHVTGQGAGNRCAHGSATSRIRISSMHG